MRIGFKQPDQFFSSCFLVCLSVSDVQACAFPGIPVWREKTAGGVGQDRGRTDGRPAGLEGLCMTMASSPRLQFNPQAASIMVKSLGAGVRLVAACQSFGFLLASAGDYLSYRLLQLGRLCHQSQQGESLQLVCQQGGVIQCDKIVGASSYHFCHIRGPSTLKGRGFVTQRRDLQEVGVMEWDVAP